MINFKGYNVDLTEDIQKQFVDGNRLSRLINKNEEDKIVQKFWDYEMAKVLPIKDKYLKCILPPETGERYYATLKARVLGNNMVIDYIVGDSSIFTPESFKEQVMEYSKNVKNFSEIAKAHILLQGGWESKLEIEVDFYDKDNPFVGENFGFPFVHPILEYPSKKLNLVTNMDFFWLLKEAKSALNDDERIEELNTDKEYAVTYNFETVWGNHPIHENCEYYYGTMICDYFYAHFRPEVWESYHNNSGKLSMEEVVGIDDYLSHYGEDYDYPTFVLTDFLNFNSNSNVNAWYRMQKYLQYAEGLLKMEDKGLHPQCGVSPKKLGELMLEDKLLALFEVYCQNNARNFSYNFASQLLAQFDMFPIRYNFEKYFEHYKKQYNIQNMSDGDVSDIHWKYFLSVPWHRMPISKEKLAKIEKAIANQKAKEESEKEIKEKM